MKIGCLGGSFDPVHLGHLVLAEAAREAIGLDRIVLMVAGAPPHKTGRALASAADRVEMARRAVAGHPGYAVDDRETRREGPSFTIDTVRELRAGLAPDDRLYWIVGSDTLPDLPGWKDGRELLDLVTFVTAARPDHDVGAALDSLRPEIGDEVVLRLAAHVVPMPAIGISSTGIRRRVRDGASIRWLVPDAVRAWIRERSLYTE